MSTRSGYVAPALSLADAIAYCARRYRTYDPTPARMSAGMARSCLPVSGDIGIRGRPVGPFFIANNFLAL